MYGKALKASFAVRQSFTNLQVKHKLKLFDSLVKPIALYGSDIWGTQLVNWETTDIDSILFKDNFIFEKLHNKFCKYVLQTGIKCSNIGTKAELGRYPLILT